MISIPDYFMKTVPTKHILCLSFWMVICIPLLVIAAWLSFIGGRSSRYTDVTNNWEACLFESNMAVLPINELLDTSPLAPLLTMLDVNIDNMRLPLGSFVYSLVYICVNTTALTLLGHVTIAFCWTRKGNLDRWMCYFVMYGLDLLITASTFSIWCVSLSLSYYTISPPLPIPTSTTSTVILLLSWLDKSNFDDINGGDNECSSAYYFILVVAVMNVSTPSK